MTDDLIARLDAWLAKEVQPMAYNGYNDTDALLREARAALVSFHQENERIEILRAMHHREIVRADAAETQLREAEARYTELRSAVSCDVTDHRAIVALAEAHRQDSEDRDAVEDKRAATAEALARLAQALARIAAHDNQRFVPDEDGYLTAPQDTPQEMARVALQMPQAGKKEHK